MNNIKSEIFKLVLSDGMLGEPNNCYLRNNCEDNIEPSTEIITLTQSLILYQYLS